MGNLPSEPQSAVSSQSDTCVGTVNVNLKRSKAVRLGHSGFSGTSIDGGNDRLSPSPRCSKPDIREDAPEPRTDTSTPAPSKHPGFRQQLKQPKEVRYGLVVDRMQRRVSRKKQKNTSKLTLYYCGVPPAETSDKQRQQKGKSPSVDSVGSGGTGSDVHLYDVVKLVTAYNQGQGNLPMSIKADRTGFTGYVEIHLNLVHPISIDQSSSRRSVDDAGVMEGRAGSESKRSVIYLNDMTTKMVIDCHTSTMSIIHDLMEKYRVVDDISNFGLFECEGRRGGPGGRRMDDKEEPLLLVLLWGPCPMHSLSLQLVSSGRKRMDTLIHWDRFTYTELSNFLRMLNQEEEKYINAIKRNYEVKRQRIEKFITAKENETDNGDKSGT